MKNLLRSRCGMSLMNVIMLLMLVGVLTTAGIKMMGPMVQRGKINDTKTTINSAVDAIISWSVANGRLPKKDVAIDEITSILPNPNDAWGKPLVYTYDGNLTVTETGGLCGRTSATLYNGQQVAFIVLSGGEDYSIDSNPVTSQAFPGGLAVDTTKDLSRVVTLDELKARAGCYGKTGGRLRIVNNELPGACSNQPYNATLFGNGGVPFTGANTGYNWTISDRPADITPNTHDYPTWSSTPSPSLVLAGTAPTTPGVHPITFSARDNNQPTANSVQRSYNLNVMPLVTPTVSGGNGTISPNTPLCVKMGNTASFNITPSSSSYTPSMSGTCGGTLSGSYPSYTYTTLSINNNCTVIASFGGSSDPAQEFREYVQSENVFVYGTAFTFSGSNVSGANATTVINGNLTTSNLNGGASISVSNIYINGTVNLDGGSASLGSSTSPGHIYVNGNMTLWSGTRHIYGDVHVNGNFRLKDARMHGNVYVKGNLELGWTPQIHQNIYYTGTLTYPNGYSAALLAKCIKVEESALPPFVMPSYTIPAPRDDAWYAAKGYVDAGLANNRKIFKQTSFTSTSWMASVSNVIIVSKGDITITGLGGSGLTGVLFAPYGKVTFDGGFFTGLVIARDGFYVTSGGTPVTFQNISNFISDTADYPF